MESRGVSPENFTCEILHRIPWGIKPGQFSGRIAKACTAVQAVIQCFDYTNGPAKLQAVSVYTVMSLTTKVTYDVWWLM